MPERSWEVDLEALVEAALREDVGDGDRTSQWAVPEAATGVAHVVAKAAGVVAGTEPAERTFRHVDSDVELAWRLEDGSWVAPGEEIVEIRGSLRSIFTAERTALNFLAHLSGVATLAARFVQAVRGTGCRVADTRKTLPGWRALEKAAVRSGGAVNHRRGLYDMVLLKENHIRAAGGVGPALRAVKGPASAERLAVEIEVRSLEELDQALAEEPDRVLLDNMSVEELEKAVERVRRLSAHRPLLEASGGVDLQRARRVAETGVDMISVGAITHSAPALNLSLLLK